MAGKNQVTLTFAGDSESLERTLANAESGSKKTEEAFDKLGSTAKQTEDDLSRLGSGSKAAEEGIDGLSSKARRTGEAVEELGDDARRAHRVIGEGGRAFGDYGTGLGGVGDRMDEVDTRAMGLSDGIQGLNDLMGGNGKLRPHEYAMAVSDLGSSMYNFVIPSLQDGGQKLTSFIDKVGGLKVAAGLAAGAAGLTALVVAIKNADDAANAKNLDQLAERLQASSFAATDANKAMVYAAASMGKLDDEFERALAAGPEQAAQFIELAAASGVSSDKLAEYRDRLETSTDAQEQATIASEEHSKALETEADRIRGVNDARRAAVDPIFAYINALDSNRQAQQQVNEADAAYREAARKHGEGSAEAAAALRDLTAAQGDSASSAADLESAASELEAQIAEHPATLSNALLALQRWRAEGSIDAQTASVMERRFRGAAAGADRIQGTRTADLHARDNASGKITSVGNRLRELDGKSATVHIGANVGASVGATLAALAAFYSAEGGVVPQYLAAGGMSGPRGTDTIPAWLTPGEMVFNKAQQAELWAVANGRRGGSGPSVNVHVSGSVVSERDIVRIIRDELQRGGFRGLAA